MPAQKETKMKKANLNLNTMYQMGAETRANDVREFAGNANARSVRKYMKALILEPYGRQMWVGDDLLPIGNLEEAVDAAVRGFNDYNEA